MSKTPGPFQHCDKCKTETGHSWIETFIYSCNTCGKETKVNLRPAIPEEQVKALMERNKHLPDEVKRDVEQELRLHPVKPSEALTEEEVKEAQVHESDLPVQGMFVKPTPIDGRMKTSMDFGTSDGSNVALYIQRHGEPIKMTGAEIIEKFGDHLSEEQKTVILDTVQDIKEKLVPAVEQKLRVKDIEDVIARGDLFADKKPEPKKGWADGL